MTEFQKRCLEVINRMANRQASLSHIAYRLKSNNLAVYSAMKSLQKQNIVGAWRKGDDRWAVLMYFISRAGEKALQEVKS